MYIHMHIYTCRYIHTDMRVFICLYVYTCMYWYILCTHIHLYIYVYIYTYIYVYIYIDIQVDTVWLSPPEWHSTQYVFWKEGFLFHNISETNRHPRWHGMTRLCSVTLDSIYIPDRSLSIVYSGKKKSLCCIPYLCSVIFELIAWSNAK